MLGASGSSGPGQKDRIVISASAPTRIDVGSTWDLPAFFLPFRNSLPCTFNMAIHPRTRVRIYETGGEGVAIDDGFGRVHIDPFKESYQGRWGFIAAACSFANVHRAYIEIRRDYPVRSGIGGSGSLAVALLGALLAYRRVRYGETMRRSRLATIASALERSIGASVTGFQDQLAALHGGANLWVWTPRSFDLPFHRIRVRLVPDTSLRFLLAYSGQQRSSSDMTARWLHGFLLGSTRHLWIEILESTRDFATALLEGNWAKAKNALEREISARLRLDPAALTDRTRRLFRIAQRNGCVPRIAGGGQGGFVWAFGEPNEISHLQIEWEENVPPGGFILRPKLATVGLRVKILDGT